MPGEIKAKVRGQLLGNRRNDGVQLLVSPGTSPLSNRIRTGSLTGENQDRGTCNRERTRVPSVLAALGIYSHEPIIRFVSPRIFRWWRPIAVKGLVYFLINLLIFACFSLLQYWRQRLFLAAMPWGPNGVLSGSGRRVSVFIRFCVRLTPATRTRIRWTSLPQWHRAAVITALLFQVRLCHSDLRGRWTGSSALLVVLIHMHTASWSGDQ